jgi:site-specific DNA-methyltransferase (adenine-specific)
MELNQTYNENNLITMAKMPDCFVDLIVTSPPYNIGIEYDNYVDKMEWDDYFKWCEKWLTECYRILKPDGRIALNHYLSLGNAKKRVSPLSKLNEIMNNIGYNHHTMAVWTDITLAKRTAWGSYLSASAPYINSPFEGILICYKDQWKKLNKGISDIPKEDFIKLTRGIWDIKTETKGLTKANFSLDFANKCIKLLSYQNDLVYDPFMGSGTVGLSCVNNNRSFIGSEISEKYCIIANNRTKLHETK